MKKISICVPCYNVSKYIDRCLESLVKQTLDDIEIICVDDCSADDTLNKLNKWCKKHNNIKVFTNIENKKSVYTRRVAVANAEGEYIMFVDSDDVLNCNACEIAYKKIQETNADIVEFTCNVVDVNDKLVNRDTEYCRITAGELNNAEVKEAFKRANVGMMLWNKIYRSQLVKNVYLRISCLNLYYKDDVYITALLYRSTNKYVGIKEKLYNYRLNSGSSRIGKMDTVLFCDRIKCADICYDWLQIFYEDGNIGDYEKNIIKSRINNWMITVNLDMLLRNADKENVKEWVDIFINAWAGRKIRKLTNHDNKIVQEIAYFQISKVLEALKAIAKSLGTELIFANEDYIVLKEKYYANKEYNINVLFNELINPGA